ncbi:MAG: hypothetical protein M5U09_22745 [Gammaproteobacteria bacterium]|nr:hypothetical protein [Gammaproteobacteria bacterium]
MMDTLGKLESRKLKGLVLTIMALLLLFAVYLVASLFINVSELVVTTISGAITTLGGGHQVAQTMADRSPYYQSPSQFVAPPAPYAAPPAPSSATPPHAPPPNTGASV